MAAIQKKHAGKCRWPARECVEALRALRRQGRDRPVIMVSSTVYGIESLLRQVYGRLVSAGWDVWISDRGTLPVDSGVSCFDNCLQAVDDCDAFLGIITGRYGTGKVGKNKSITHQEMERAINLNRKRWFLVQQEVVVARQLFRPILKAIPDVQSKVDLGRNPMLDDFRILDMYNLALRDSTAVEKRVGNWVQAFRNSEEAMLYVESQLGRPATIFPQYFVGHRKP